MYEESTNNKGSFIKDLVIKLLYMLLFLFLFMWLYPAPKVDLSDVKVNVDETALKPLLNGVFADNIEAMRSAARTYYTVERLPKNKGDNSTLSLQDMLNKKMVTPFVGEDGKTCDTKASYVKVTKNDDDYSLKVYLECGDKKDYINDTIGCNSTCIGCITSPETIASKVVSAIKTNNVSVGTTKTAYTNTSTTKTTTPTNTSKPVYVSPTVYTYIKEDTKWNLDNTWITEAKSGSDIRLADTRTNTKTETKSDDYTYRTVSWIWGYTTNFDYRLHLNNIPSNATNVKITSSNKFPYSYSNSYGTNININELNQYYQNRWSCVISMNDLGCPTPNGSGNLPSSYDYDMPNNWTYTIKHPQKTYGNGFTNYGYSNYGNYGYGSYQANGPWVVDIRVINKSYVSGDDTQYLAPIKFKVQWDIETQKQIKEYKYEYKTTTYDEKTSTNPNDSALINQGYRRK